MFALILEPKEVSDSVVNSRANATHNGLCFCTQGNAVAQENDKQITLTINPDARPREAEVPHSVRRDPGTGRRVGWSGRVPSQHPRALRRLMGWVPELPNHSSIDRPSAPDGRVREIECPRPYLARACKEAGVPRNAPKDPRVQVVHFAPRVAFTARTISG